MPIHDTMKCIFCFHTLKNTDICFETVDDQVDPTPDPIKLNFQRRTEPYMDEFDMQAMSRQPICQYQEGSTEFELDPETGIPVAWNQSVQESTYTLKSRKRICAFCHMPLPSQFGKRPNMMVGFCGNTGAGKTVYMLSLIHDLKSRVHGMAVAPDPIFYSQLKTDYKSMYDAMYGGEDGYRLPQATPPNDTLSPLVLNCSYRGRDFMITLYDMAGEGTKHASYMAKQALFLANTAGVIYLKDPDYFPGMPMANVALEEHAYLDDLFDAITSRRQDTQPAYIAITMTKIDKLLDIYGSNREFRSIIGATFDRDDVNIHADGFDAPAARAISGRMHKLYDWSNTEDQAILGIYNKQLSRADREDTVRSGLFGRLFSGKKKRRDEEDTGNQPVMLFGASPLGRNPGLYHEAGDDSTYYASQEPRGLHNVDPILWLLYCHGLFPARRTVED